MSESRDAFSLPGDLVLVLGVYPVEVWAMPLRHRVGVVMPASIGIVVSQGFEPFAHGMSYVLWSIPNICGWIYDGFLLRVTL